MDDQSQVVCAFFFISVGDCIVAVNDSSTVNVTHQQAVEALKAAGGVVTLVIMLVCDLICQILFEANQTNTVHIYSAALCCSLQYLCVKKPLEMANDRRNGVVHVTLQLNYAIITLSSD